MKDFSTASRRTSSAIRPGPQNLNDIRAPDSFDITFDKVSFAYDRATEVLKDVSFRVPSGQILGIVGRSGSGKTTLSQLVLGMRRPSAGSALVGDVPAAPVAKGDGVSPVALVAQEAILFQGSIASNISFFRDVSPEQIEDASRAAHLHEDVAMMAQGYETLVGEGGGALSGGQRQRLAIARALVGSPCVLVLDEPTSALDGRSEHLIRRTLSELRGHVTVIVISHRLATVEDCDLLLVLDGGRRADFGPRDEVVTGDAFRQVAEAARYGHPDSPRTMGMNKESGTSADRPMMLCVAICTRNRPQQLADCLHSLESSDLVDEVIVSSDGSDDETETVALSAADKFRHFSFLRGPRSGLAANRNNCIASIRSEYVLFLDDDARLSASFVEVALSAAGPDRLVTGWELRNDAKVTPHDPDFLGFQRLAPSGDPKGIVINSTLFPTAFLRSRGFDPFYKFGSEEIDIAFGAAKRGLKIVEIDEGNVHLHVESSREGNDEAAMASRVYFGVRRYRDYERSGSNLTVFLVLALANALGFRIKKRQFTSLPSITCAFGRAVCAAWFMTDETLKVAPSCRVPPRALGRVGQPKTPRRPSLF